MQIPIERLDPETLRRVIEEYITREGTDYGRSNSSLDAKVEQVRRQLKRGEAILVYDEIGETCQILPRASWQLFQKGANLSGDVSAQRLHPDS